MTLPTVLTKQGLQPQAPVDILTKLIGLVSAETPGYTANLPGSLIEDISSTDVAAISLIDQARIDLVNSMTPYAANEFILNQLAQIYGIQPGTTTNTSVYVTFSGSTGYIIPKGFTVSDGVYQYVVVNGGVIPTGGVSDPLYCLATITGSWAVPVGTVNTIATSVPTGYSVACTNVTAGVPSTGAQTIDDYRAQIIKAGLVASTGMANMLTTQLTKVTGVQPSLIAIQLQTNGKWKVLVGGGDPYSVAYAIYLALGGSIGQLTGSIMNVFSVTNANPAVVVTGLNHGLGANGSVINALSSSNINITGLTGTLGTLINGVNLTIYIISQNSFALYGPPVAAGSFSVSTRYIIYSLGTTTQTQWNTIAGTTGITYTVGSTFVAATNGSSSGNGKASPTLNSTSSSSYSGTGGLVTPNPRNQNISIIDGSNSYNIPYVMPPQQTVSVNVVWNAYNLSATIPPATVSQLGSPAIASYVNNVPLGQPLNNNSIKEAFVNSIQAFVDPNLVTKLNITVYINGILTAPISGTEGVIGDIESYFYTTQNLITISQG